MTKKYQATFKCYVTVDFEEDESDNALVLVDQAHEALIHCSHPSLDDGEIVELLYETGKDEWKSINFREKC